MNAKTDKPASEPYNEVLQGGNKDESLTLEVLGAVEEKENLTQRHLAQTMGVALGLANSYLKRCVQKGLVKVKQAPANRYLYYLTPKGLAEKSRLTAEYLSSSFSFYRRSSDSFEKLYKHCRANGLESVMLCGQSELAEIACLKALESGIKIQAVFDLAVSGKYFLGKQLISDIAEVKECDLYILTALNNSESVLKILLARVDNKKIVVPNVLKKFNQSLINKYLDNL